VASCVVVGRIFLTADQELRVEELAVIARADLIDGRRIQVDEDGPGDIFALPSFREEGLECTTFADILCVWVRFTITAETMLKQVPGGL
jgi:hypothetical protein